MSQASAVASEPKHTPGPFLDDDRRAVELALFMKTMRESRPSINLERHQPGDYFVSQQTMEMWRGWQARAAIARATGAQEP